MKTTKSNFWICSDKLIIRVLKCFMSDPLIHLPQHKRMGNERFVFTYQSLTFGAKNSSAGKFMLPKSEKLYYQILIIIGLV